MNILIMTAVAVEKEVVLRGLDYCENFHVALAGVGAASAAARTAAALAEASYDLVISTGIAGAFTGKAAIGSIVIANEVVAADLGAQTQDGFLSVEQLGFGSTSVPVAEGMAERLKLALQAAGLEARSGAVLTVSTATGTADTAAKLAARIPEAAAEAMEGYGVGIAAMHKGVPFLEIRAISNAVGPRDRAAWRIEEALHALEAASRITKEVLLEC